MRVLDDDYFPVLGKDCQCPYCGSINDGAIATKTNLEIMDVSSPSENSIMICAYCGNLSLYGKGFKFEKIPAEKLNEMIKEDPELESTLKKIRRAVTAVMIDKFINK